MKTKIKFNKKQLFKAHKLILKFNKTKFREIDWSVFFDKIPKEALDEFALIGLSNVDLIFSDFLARYKDKVKIKEL